MSAQLNPVLQDSVSGLFYVVGDEVEISGGGGETDLALGSVTTTTLEIESSNGDPVVLPAATTSTAGLLPSADKIKLDAQAEATIPDGGFLGATGGVAVGRTKAQTQGDLNVNKMERGIELVGTVTNRDYNFTRYAPCAGTIDTLRISSTSGTCSADIKINGTSVTGLSAVSVTSTEADTSSSAAYTFAVGDKISITITSVSSCTDLHAYLFMTRG